MRARDDYFEISILTQPQHPVAIFSETLHTATVGTPIDFDASASTDDGTIISYEWDFGDGNQAVGITASHAYLSPGTYIVRLTVMDNDGLTGSVQAIKTITPLNQVIPEIPLGTIMGLVTMLAAFAVFKSGRAGARTLRSAGNIPLV